MSLTISVFVVDDDPGVRDSLRYLLESNGHHVETFETARAMIDRARRSLAGCLIADLRLPGMSGLDMCDALHDMGVRLPTLVITGHGDVSAAVRAMKAGAVDFLEKPFSDSALLDHVATALDLDQRHRVSDAELRRVAGLYDLLTPRERQVMAAVVEGKLNKQIAADLGLSHKTIEVHRAHVMDKMNAGSLAQLVRMAVLIEPYLATEPMGLSA
ncbi:MAG: response regulator [Planctomycetota bacterium]